jgi:hypothetical protein
VQESLQTVISAAPELLLDELIGRIRTMANERRIQPGSLGPTLVGQAVESEAEALTNYHRDLARALSWVGQNLQAIQRTQAMLEARIGEEAARHQRDGRKLQEVVDSLQRRAENAERVVELTEARMASLDQRLTRAVDELSRRVELELAMAEGRMRLMADQRATGGVR